MNKKEIVELINKGYTEELRTKADSIRRDNYGRSVFLRGLIEFTNYCKNGCFYCGLQHNNKSVNRYRMDKQEILTCCESGYALGFRTFVLQGGEDPFYTDKDMTDIIYSIKSIYPECALTLSLGEKSRTAYKMFFDAGADRYLLRHEIERASCRERV